jgi:Ser/Thr protein kinase RdoA (MazF antagonist)
VARVGGTLLWAYPYDPSLPGLADAAWGPTVRATTGPRRPAAVSVRPLRYRPRRRAVFRYRTLHVGRRGRRWETSFGKVLSRDKADRLAAAAPALEAAGRRVPLAVPVARAGRDVLVFPALEGRSLRDVLVLGGSLPSPARVAGLPGALAVAVAEAGAEVRAERPPPMDLAVPGADLVARLVPSAEDEARRVVDAVREDGAREGMPKTIVHGDLYEAQVFVGEGFTLGLIDLDDLGRGDPALDAANFCAHLLALALAVPRAANRLVAYHRLVRPAFAEALGLPTAALAWREALCMLLLAAGPFRVLDPAWPAEVGRRVALAVRLLKEG